MHARRTVRTARQMVVNHGWATAVRTARDHLKKRLRRTSQLTDDTITWLPTAEHEFDRQYGVDTILLPVTTPLTGAVKESKHWRVVYDDGSAIIFRLVAQAAQGQQISTGSSRTGWEGRDGNVKRPRSILWRGRLIQTSGGEKL